MAFNWAKESKDEKGPTETLERLLPLLVPLLWVGLAIAGWVCWVGGGLGGFIAAHREATLDIWVSCGVLCMMAKFHVLLLGLLLLLSLSSVVWATMGWSRAVFGFGFGCRWYSGWAEVG